MTRSMMFRQRGGLVALVAYIQGLEQPFTAPIPTPH